MIRISNLSKTYNKGKNTVTALQNIHLEVQQGDIFGIIGLSGAGKSSLIRCINRIEEPTEGDVWIQDVNLVNLQGNELRKARKKIGMIFQNFNLLNSKTVFENIAFPLRLENMAEKVMREKVNSLLTLVELSDKAQSYPSQLSGGQKQRVGIARALASNPHVLLCDEATSALDPKTTKQILSLLKDINRSMGLTIVIITHEMEVIKEICNRVAILEGGRIVEQGDTIEVFSKPGNEITKHFIDQIQALPNHLQGGKILSLSFTQGSAGEPIIARLMQTFGIEANILSGKIEYIQDKPIGKLIIELTADCHQLVDIVHYLETQHVKVEVIKSA